MEEKIMIERFTRSQRVQHFLLLVSFIILIVTGLALKFHDSWFGKLVITLEGGVIARGIFHRFAAVLLIFVAFYHFFYIIFTRYGHDEFLLVLPKFKDFKAAFQSVKFTLGLSAEHAEIDKYAPPDKFQYWAVVAGSFLMIITGLVLWYQTQAMLVLPKWAIDITRVVHSYQGVIIAVVILLWHLYIVHLNPKRFPMSRIWIDGKVSLEELKVEHPLEYERKYQGVADENK
ncbi:MAG: cytochrome b/b6 domain-containing protein [candidate division Zixibacteria bacterium]|nr:cytochrome b/b6 domain-containing protein [candidate division Zixibacteria bacterium]